MSSKNVIEIVSAYLVSNGYGGLVNDDEGCGCELGDLEPCGIICADCTAGYKHVDPTDPELWVISRNTEPPTDEGWQRIRSEA